MWSAIIKIIWELHNNQNHVNTKLKRDWKRTNLDLLNIKKEKDDDDDDGNKQQRWISSFGLNIISLDNYEEFADKFYKALINK